MKTAEPAYHHGDLPAALLAAVEEIIDERGYTDLSLREAARRAGVSHSAPAYHFGDKEGMLVAFCHQGFELLYGKMVAAYERRSAGSSVERVHGIGKAYVTFAVEHRAHFEIMFRAGIDKLAHEELHEGGSRVFGLLRQAIGELQEDGHFVARTCSRSRSTCGRSSTGSRRSWWTARCLQHWPAPISPCFSMECSESQCRSRTSGISSASAVGVGDSEQHCHLYGPFPRQPANEQFMSVVRTFHHPDLSCPGCNVSPKGARLPDPSDLCSE